VTDANVYLGRLPADCFLGGEQILDTAAAADAVSALADEFGIGAAQLALGVLRIADSTMEAAIRVISIERGHDPRDFSLVCFGGAGGLHAVSLAVALNIPRVLVPPDAGTLSAMGMLLSDTGREYSRTVLGKASLGDTSLEAAVSDLEALARRDLPAGDVRLQRSLDLRYRGQGFELNVPWSEDPTAAFHELHEQRYGYADATRSIEVVNARVRATVPTRHDLPDPSPVGERSAAPAFDTREVFFDESAVATGLYRREELRPGHVVAGPAVITEYSSTTLIPPRWEANVDGHGNLLITPESSP
jgi:N-methylhydantoinase A